MISIKINISSGVFISDLSRNSFDNVLYVSCELFCSLIMSNTIVWHINAFINVVGQSLPNYRRKCPSLERETGLFPLRNRWCVRSTARLVVHSLYADTDLTAPNAHHRCISMQHITGHPNDEIPLSHDHKSRDPPFFLWYRANPAIVIAFFARDSRPRRLFSAGAEIRHAAFFSSVQMRDASSALTWFRK